MPRHYIGQLENNHRWRHSYIILHYLIFSFEISSPCTNINSRTRLYNASASPVSRLRSAGSLATTEYTQRLRYGRLDQPDRKYVLMWRKAFLTPRLSFFFILNWQYFVKRAIVALIFFSAIFAPLNFLILDIALELEYRAGWMLWACIADRLHQSTTLYKLRAISSRAEYFMSTWPNEGMMWNEAFYLLGAQRGKQPAKK